MRISLCPRCNYSLDGLPPEGNCPECGRPYDSAKCIVLYGWALGATATLTSAKPKFWRWRLVTGLLGPCYFVFLFRANGIALLVVMSLSLIPLGLEAYRRYFHSGAAPAQARFTPAGCVQVEATTALMPFEGADSKTPLPWSQVTRIAIDCVRVGVYQITCAAESKAHVSIEVRMDYEDAVVFRTRLQNWIDAYHAARVGLTEDVAK